MTDKDQDGWMIETNQWGGVRRYRKSPTGGIEYEMTINGIPESELEDYNRRERERKKKFFAEEKRRNAESAATPVRFCPLLDGQNDETACLGPECALFVEDTCIFARRQVTEVRKTIGRKCPFSRFNGRCNEKCVLCRDGGCTFLQT